MNKQNNESQPPLEDVGSLDPENWSEFRSIAHALLDNCLDRLESARELPWRPPSGEITQTEPLPLEGMHINQLSEALTNEVMPYATGNTHPRFFGWVHGTGLPVGLLAEMVAATMNSNCGGRNHGAVHIERQVVEWCKQIFEWPESTGGILTSGTSMATLLALASARVKVLGKTVRKQGIQDQANLTVYAATGTHQCISKALELMGAGADALRLIPIDPNTGSMSIEHLSNQLKIDRESGQLPWCIVGTAGSVNTGRFDQLSELADFCEEQKIWLHIDGAFGAWIKLADKNWSHLATGIERADSIAFDFHKWMYVQYDAAAVLVRDNQYLNAAFANRAAYLESADEGLAGGEPWYCDQGIELSRGFKALKVWSAIKTHGLTRIGQNISENCRQAALMGELIEQSNELELVRPVISNVVCFRVCLSTSDENLKATHEAIALELQLNGTAVISTTTVDDSSALRAAIVNHRTTFEDIYTTVNAVIGQVNE